jgi:hypothetical protein
MQNIFSCSIKRTSLARFSSSKEKRFIPSATERRRREADVDDESVGRKSRPSFQTVRNFPGEGESRRVETGVGGSRNRRRQQVVARLDGRGPSPDRSQPGEIIINLFFSSLSLCTTLSAKLWGLTCNGTVHIRHLCRITAVLSCYRCLINTGVEKMNCI